MTVSAKDTASTRPYLIRALHEWCSENGFSPYIAVQVDSSVQVPMDFVKNGEIVLNVSFDATSSLRLGNDFIEFKARFGGKTQEIAVPIEQVIAIYARENGQGMAFPSPPVKGSRVGKDLSTDLATTDARLPVRSSLHSVPSDVVTDHKAETNVDGLPPTPPTVAGGGPRLRRIK
jgi:stringent starvation protein B